jgi:hypothetical protein
MLYGYLMLMLMYVIHPFLSLSVMYVLYPGYTHTVYMTYLHGSLLGKGPFAPFHPDKVLCFLSELNQG